MNIDKNGSGFSDDDVVRSVVKGNTRNFEIIIDRYKLKIINFVFRMISDYDESQNISQEVFLQIFKNIRKYRENNTFSSFIFTIAKNTTLNYIKKRNRVTLFSGLSKGGEEEKILSNKESPSVRLQKEEREKLIREGLMNMNVNQRLALILKIYLGFSYKKIAEVTGWSQPKLETLISRGKTNLTNYVQLQEKGGVDV